MLLEKQRVEIFINLMNVRFKTVNINFFFLYRKNLFTKEKLNKKEQHKLYTLLTIYRSDIVGKTNQFKHNISLFINLFCLHFCSTLGTELTIIFLYCINCRNVYRVPGTVSQVFNRTATH